MRAIKRIRYGVKELDRLKKMLVNAGEIEVKEGGEVEHICLGNLFSFIILSHNMGYFAQINTLVKWLFENEDRHDILMLFDYAVLLYLYVYVFIFHILLHL